jgi:hypothetical protein
MNKPKNSRHTLKCVEVQNAYKTKNNNFLHLVKFEDGNTIYIAETLDANPVSSFRAGVASMFEVTHPGSNGKLDWIRWEADSGAQPVRQQDTVTQSYQQPQQLQQPKDVSDSGIAQTAFLGAVQYGLKNDWTIEQIIEHTHIFAGNIKRIARSIANDRTI